MYGKLIENHIKCTVYKLTSIHYCNHTLTLLLGLIVALSNMLYTLSKIQETSCMSAYIWTVHTVV